MGGPVLSLICRLGDVRGAIPLEHVLEIMRPLPVTPVRDMPSFVLGVAVVRGRPLPVIDMRRLVLGGEGAAVTRFVCLRASPTGVGERLVVLAVEEVLGVTALPETELTALPPLLSEGNAEHVSALGRLEAELLVVLSASRTLPDAAWECLSRAEAP